MVKIKRINTFFIVVVRQNHPANRPRRDQVSWFDGTIMLKMHVTSGAFPLCTALKMGSLNFIFQTHLWYLLLTLEEWFSKMDKKIEMAFGLWESGRITASLNCCWSRNQLVKETELLQACSHHSVLGRRIWYYSGQGLLRCIKCLNKIDVALPQ